MKRIVVLALAIFGILSVSCEKYEDGRPSKDVRNEFDRMYPDAKDVEWEPEGGYWKVSFETGRNPDRLDHEAWYDRDGEWVRTETDVYLSLVPQAVKDLLEASEYGSGIVDGSDVEYVQTPQEEYYRFKVNVGGSTVYVNVSEDGSVTERNIDW